VFVQKVENGEPFRKGDTLLCAVRVVQTKRAGVLKIERAIVKVKSHTQRFGEQAQLV
jgi:hypothetical protein